MCLNLHSKIQEGNTEWRALQAFSQIKIDIIFQCVLVF
jgi:hypothetical protein